MFGAGKGRAGVLTGGGAVGVEGGSVTGALVFEIGFSVLITVFLFIIKSLFAVV